MTVSSTHPWARIRPPLPAPPAVKPRRGWLAPTGLILLSLVPIAAGASRLTQLTTGAAVTADNARFFDSPVPVGVHIVSVTVFSLLGALQFAPSLRRHRWHRRAGRIVAPAGLLAALSGMWMALFYTLPAHDGAALLVLRLVFGTAMATSIVVAFVAIRTGDVRTHSAWMTRAYAIGMGAGTQVFTGLAAFLLVGTPDAATWAVFMGAGWVINLAVAEFVIRRRVIRLRREAQPSVRSATASATASAHLS
jgi:uncharacterized membrane protein